MTGIWDTKADGVKKGDNLRDVTPITNKIKVDENGYTHYVFSKALFNNPWYTIPDEDLELFRKYLDGGSRAYPSDGSVPCDIVAGETRKVLNTLVACSNDLEHPHCDEAKKALKHGKFALVRGTLKLYLGKYTTRDWRRKRFTDDIDFWTFEVPLLEHSLKSCSFVKNKDTREWEKQVNWVNPDTKERREQVLIAANDTNQLLDFGAGSYLEGSSLKEIFNKKLKRGHDVDLSDVINVAMVNNGIDGEHKDEWLDAWSSFEEATNIRSTRITSNLISLCRYALGIAEHLDKVNVALKKYNNRIFDISVYPDEDIKRIIRTSIHWEAFFESNGLDATREMLHDFFHEQAEFKPLHAENLRNFAKGILKLLNSKYEYLKVIFEIEN